jgi:hypothetical protein
MKSFTPDSLLIASRQELIDIILEQATQIDKLFNEITELKMKFEWLQRQMFGTKSERFIPSADLQTALDLGVVSKQDLDNAEESVPVTYTRTKKASIEPVRGGGSKRPKTTTRSARPMHSTPCVSGMPWNGKPGKRDCPSMNGLR